MNIDLPWTAERLSIERPILQRRQFAMRTMTKILAGCGGLCGPCGRGSVGRAILRIQYSPYSYNQYRSYGYAPRR